MVEEISVDENALTNLIQHIVAAVHPEKIILFGSRATGTARPDSDIDLLVQVETGRNMQETTKEVYRVLRRMPQRPGVDVDIVVKERAFVERYGDLVGTVVRPALREGKVLYAR
jgi:predicted nucleotidyltransferase